jgi:hypothetical protein
MSLPATGRYGVGVAPGGLALVQELLNTKAAGGQADLLAELGTARDLAPVELTDADLPRLRTLRAALSHALGGDRPGDAAPAGPPGGGAPGGGTPGGGTAGGHHGGGVAGTVRLTLDPAAGTVGTQARGTGAQWIAATVLTEALLAQRDGTWSRLKLCRKPACAVAFYDRSRNNSGVWHDVRRCGNAANLRASRARRRAVSRPEHGDGPTRPSLAP